ncbi:MAG: DUF2974 domain-containing protein [Clostridia bacterium]|nr:DUF2974 domain-containing protein [Clostridia bacterium]
MATVFDYLDWRGDLSFTQSDVNEVDNLIFSLLCYLPFDEILTPHTDKRPLSLLAVARQYLRAYRDRPTKLGLILPPQTVTLLAKAAKCPRFAKVRMRSYVNDLSPEEERQFSAVTYLLDNGKSFVAFRGTDDTLIGWKESFSMSFLHPVPAQTAAARYLNQVAKQTDGSLILGGHSKGGNLAVYAAVQAEEGIEKRIERVYNNDGPGFTADFLRSENYQALRERVCTIIPQSSVVGMLLEHEDRYDVIKSTANGLLQHNGFSWEVLGASFLHLDTVTEESRSIDRSVKKWLSQLDSERRQSIIDSIFDKLAAENAQTLTDLGNDKLKLLRVWNQLDPEARNMFKKFISLFVKESARLRKKSEEMAKRNELPTGKKATPSSPK